MVRSCWLLVCLWMYFVFGELRDSVFVVDGGKREREGLLDLSVLGCSAIESWGSEV